MGRGIHLARRLGRDATPRKEMLDSFYLKAEQDEDR